MSGVLPPNVPFAAEINRASNAASFSAFVISAIQHNETDALPDAATIISQDGGRGVMQLTSGYPPDWTDAYTNILYAATMFLWPAEEFWAISEQGEDLVRCIAAEYNAGRGNALAGHESGDVDTFTTNNYGTRALAYYKGLAG